MKILFVTALLPYPLVSGGQIRFYNLLRLLSQNHEITLFSFIRNEAERQYVKQLSFLHDIALFNRGKRWSLQYVLRAISGSRSLLAESYANDFMKEAIAQKIRSQRFDLIHIEPFYVLPSLPPTDIPLVIGEHNVEFEVYSDYAKKLKNPVIRKIVEIEVKRIRREEITALSRASRIVAVSHEDAKKLTSLSSHARVSVVANGIDDSFFEFKERSFLSNKQKFIFVGNFLWLPNRELLSRLVNDIWPHIRDVLPASELTIVGKNVPYGFTGNPDLGISYKSSVEDIRNSYTDSDVLIAPIAVSGGSKYKIIEAAACGLSIITSAEGVAGLDRKMLSYVHVAQTVQQYVDAAKRIYENPEITQKMCRRARDLVRTLYAWKSIAPQLERVWEESI